MTQLQPAPDRSSAPADSRAEAAALLARARGVLEAGDIAQAIALARQAAAGQDETGPVARDAFYLEAVAQRYARAHQAALIAVERLVQHHPGFARGHQEHGYILLALGRPADAQAAFHQAIGLNPALPGSWAQLVQLNEAAGMRERAGHARAQHAYFSALPPPLLAVAGMIHEDRLAEAEPICRAFLSRHPTHVEAMRMLADIGQHFHAMDEAEFLLESAVLLEPDNVGARYDYVGVLGKRQKFTAALEQATILHKADPDSQMIASLYADQNQAVGNFDEALAIYEQRLAEQPGNASYHLTYGHLMKTLDRIPEAVEAYRRCYALQSDHGVAYWSLANLKTYRFSEAEIAAMRAHEQDPATALSDRYHLCFALGKGLEDRGDYAESFACYERGNRLKRDEVGYDWRRISREIDEQIAHCTPALFERFQGMGDLRADPIFIVGLPRAGSTLLEQILASHSQIEGTMELPNILSLAHRLNGPRRVGEAARYPANLGELGPDQFAAFGAAYLSDTAIQRKRGTPFFIDKMPNNFRHIGLIHMILPNARIIDARRGAMGCCFSGFKQLFAEGQEFTYGLEEVGHYYRDYVRLMDHWDRVLPGKVLKVCYEDVVSDIENQVRRILDFLDLPFEDNCLAFHRTERAVRTASSQQVRQPLYRSGVDQWRKYEAFLSPLASILGDLAE